MTGICPVCERRIAILDRGMAKHGHYKVAGPCLGWHQQPILGSIYPVEANAPLSLTGGIQVGIDPASEAA